MILFVNNASLDTLHSYIGKVITFTSDCDMFDNFKVTGLLTDIVNTGKNFEYMFKVKRLIDNKITDKIINISSNMSNSAIHTINK